MPACFMDEMKWKKNQTYALQGVKIKGGAELFLFFS